MAESHDDDHHGNSLAAWVMVGIVLLATAVMSLAVVLASVGLFIAGVVLTVIGLVAGKGRARAGQAVPGAGARPDSNLS